MKKTKNKNDNGDVTEAQVMEQAEAAEAVRDEAGGDATIDPAGDPVERLEAKVASLHDALLRTKADYQNLQRRSTIERSEAVRYANAELMKSLLSVIDDFERSLEAAEKTDKLDAVVEGVRLVYDNLMRALTTHGLNRIEALHQPFDPHVHEAMMQQPSAEVSPGTVLEEVVRGYQLRDRVLRPTRVIVAKQVDEKKEEAGSEDAK